MAMQKVQWTKSYRLFKRSYDNRDLELKEHKALKRSMERNGFLPCFPIVCSRNGSKQLTIKDGQHRFAFAEALGLPVYWIEDNTDFDVAEANSTAKGWKLKDYATRFANQGAESYQDLLAFSEMHGIPLGLSLSLLSGTTNLSGQKPLFTVGQWKIRDQKWADSVVAVYTPMTTLAKELANARFIQACMRVCRVPEFESKRLLQNSARCRDKLLSYSTTDAYLDMIEEVYNFGRRELFGLKAAAMMEMKKRNPVNGKH